MHFWGDKLSQKARKRQKVGAAVLQPCRAGGCLEALLQGVSGQTSKTPARLRRASRGSSRWRRLFNTLISFIFLLSLLIVSHSHCIRSGSEVSLCQHRSSRSLSWPPSSLLPLVPPHFQHPGSVGAPSSSPPPCAAPDPAGTQHPCSRQSPAPHVSSAQWCWSWEGRVKEKKKTSFTHCSILSMKEQHYGAPLMHLSQQFWFWAQILTKSQQHEPQPLQCHHSPRALQGRGSCTGPPGREQAGAGITKVNPSMPSQSERETNIQA